MAELDLEKISVKSALQPLEDVITSLKAQAVELANVVKSFETSRDLDDHISELQSLSGQIKANENELAKVTDWIVSKRVENKL